MEACAVRDPAHILPGSVGTHVARIQIAVAILDGASIDSKEAKSHTYGPSTAGTVLAYKKKRKIINWSYQQQADNIVGKMTIAALDAEMCIKEDSYTRLRWVPRYKYENCGSRGKATTRSGRFHDRRHFSSCHSILQVALGLVLRRLAADAPMLA